MKHRRRPLVFIAIFFALGILLGHLYKLSFAWLAGLTLLLLLLTAISLARRRAVSTLLALGTCVALGALLYTNARFPTESLSEQIDKIQHVRGIVVSYPDHGPERSRFVLKPLNAPGYLQVIYDHGAAGARIEMVGLQLHKIVFSRYARRAALSLRCRL
jgi:hypothetical protein